MNNIKVDENEQDGEVISLTASMPYQGKAVDMSNHQVNQYVAKLLVALAEKLQATNIFFEFDGIDQPVFWDDGRVSLTANLFVP